MAGWNRGSEAVSTEMMHRAIQMQKGRVRCIIDGRATVTSAFVYGTVELPEMSLR